MKTIYQKDNYGNRTAFEVSDDIADTLAKTRRAIWRNDAKERYYRAASLDGMTDYDKRTSCQAVNPEDIYIAAEQQSELREKLIAALKLLTPEQARLVGLLQKSLGIREIARLLGKSHVTVLEMRKAIQKKVERFLR